VYHVNSIVGDWHNVLAKCPEEKDMKRMMCLFAMLMVIPCVANSAVFTFNPNPADLWGLDHGSYYTWGILWSLPQGQVIQEATLNITNISNWDNGANVLHIHLLDNPTVGTYNYVDGQSNSDQFAGQGVLIDSFKDINGSGTPDNLSYSFLSLGLLDDLTSYSGDGVSGFGFDPDCHFWNGGVEFVIQTTHAPVPSTLLLLGSGLLGLVGVNRRKRKN
jgi:hypothetical protein